MFYVTIALLGFFALLNLMGMTESANFATVIFIAHVASLILLAGACIYHFSTNFDTFIQNIKQPDDGQGVPYYIFFGFSAALLGVSGFETSANFIEEQAEGVFPKTLRNMWIGVATFNPILSFLSLAMLPMAQIRDPNNTNNLLAAMGKVAAGDWLSILVSVDGFLVLAGAVLTSYVGVTGLIRRMALDRCLPQFLLHTNRLRGTNHWIILLFFAATSSLYWIVGGDVTTLEGDFILLLLIEAVSPYVFLLSFRCLFNGFFECNDDVCGWKHAFEV